MTVAAAPTARMPVPRPGPRLGGGDLVVLVALAPVLVSRYDVVAAGLLAALGLVGALRALHDGRLAHAAVAFSVLWACLLISGIGAGSLPPPNGWRTFLATDGRILLVVGPVLYLGGGRARYGPADLHRPFVLVGWVLGLEAAIHPLLGDRLFTGTLSSHHSAGAVAAVTIVVLTTLLAGGLVHNGRMSTVVAVAGALAALALSGSRAALLGSGAALLAVVIRRLSLGRRALALVAGGLLVFVAMSAVPRFAELPGNTAAAARGVFTGEELERAGVSVSSRNTALRVEAWRLAAAAGADQPFVGVGAFRSDDVITAALGVERGVARSDAGVNSVFSAHNAYLYAWAELGMLGLVLHGLPYLLLARLAGASTPALAPYRALTYGALSVLGVAAFTSNAIASPAAVIPVLAVAFALRERS